MCVVMIALLRSLPNQAGCCVDDRAGALDPDKIITNGLKNALKIFPACLEITRGMFRFFFLQGVKLMFSVRMGILFICITPISPAANFSFC